MLRKECAFCFRLLAMDFSETAYDLVAFGQKRLKTRELEFGSFGWQNALANLALGPLRRVLSVFVLASFRGSPRSLSLKPDPKT